MKNLILIIATLVGLLLSMITLAYEVWQQKKQEKNQITEMTPETSTEGKIVSVGKKKIQLGSANAASEFGKRPDMGLPTITGFY